MTVGVLPNQCNSSLIVHHEPLSFVDAQSACGNSFARLPLRTSKEETQCFKNYFADKPYTWFDGRRPELAGSALSGGRCFLDGSRTESCPPDIGFVCISERFEADIPKSSVYYSSISTSKVVITADDYFGTDESRTSLETTTAAEDHAKSSGLEQLASRQGSNERPFRVTRPTLRSEASEKLSEKVHSQHIFDLSNSVKESGPIDDPYTDPEEQRDAIPDSRDGHLFRRNALDGGEFLVPGNDTSLKTADEALSLCFEKRADYKVLDRGHPDDLYLGLLRMIGVDVGAFWVLKRNKSEMTSGRCPLVEASLDSGVIRRTRPCNQSIAIAICEPRKCPTIVGSYGVTWNETEPGSHVIRSCKKRLGSEFGYIRRSCGKTGYWDEEQILCHRSYEDWFRSYHPNISESSVKSHSAKKLQNDRAILGSRHGIGGQLLRDLTSGTSDAEEAAKQIMREVIVPAVENLEDKTGLKQVTELARDVVAAVGARLGVNQTIRVEGASFGYAVSRRGVKDEVNEIHSHVRGSEVILRGRFFGTTSLTMGHIVMSNIPERVAQPDETDPWARAVVNTPLVEFFVTDADTEGRIRHGDISVELSFPLIRRKTKRSSVKCVFFQPESEYYSDEGCVYLANVSDSKTSVCVCNHTTSFAALLLPSESAVTHAQAKFLQYMTAIGMPLSMICLLICIPIFTFIREQHEERNTIHRNLCVSLLAGDIVLIISGYGDHHMVCTPLGSLVHFCFLSALLWMGLEGVHIIHIMWLVFTKSGIPLAVYYIIGYGLSFVIVAGTNLAFEEPYERTAQLCFLSRDNMAILGFVVPLTVSTEFLFLEPIHQQR
ncbi:uncharacterized protein LOC100905435 [Galendromus occidentalis]|uniref:Uncharacterized protein LOC100905435 n=1 Tax=Galendromus occidentalis TaxID=34638 RepID=A0AAJ6QU59_9ACAR|nr:uncharacterized protein LOC100905435 [Galendromus occidentalis]